MKILHYALGFPPYRSGGLTKFCIDIMSQQREMGHEVALLWPGSMKLIRRTIKIIQRKENNGVGSFELINPLPVSYDEGIIDIQAFMKQGSRSIYAAFLKRFQPQVIHVHTLMGLHKEFIECARNMNIHIVFSVHDFFPVCPKVTMFCNGKNCETVKTYEKCPECNLSALSLTEIAVLQSSVYRTLKNTAIIKRFRKSHRDQYLTGTLSKRQKCSDLKINEASIEAYRALRLYYGNMVSKMDIVHYNSNITKEVFERCFEVRQSEVVSISHADIIDRRVVKIFAFPIHMTYLGPQSEAKGFILLKTVLDELWKENQNFVLNIYFQPRELSPYMRVHDRYNYRDLDKVFLYTDVIVAPSVLYETFGYTVLEALSFGVPVIISDKVGAKDIVPEGCGIIIEQLDKEHLKQALRELTPTILRQMNQNILLKATIMSVEEMTQSIMEKCY